MNLRGYFLRYLQPNVVFLNYTVGSIMQVSFKSLNFFQLTTTDNILAYCNFFLVPTIRKYRALNGLSTETYETLHKYYVKNPYRSSNRKNVLRQLVNNVS